MKKFYQANIILLVAFLILIATKSQLKANAQLLAFFYSPSFQIIEFNSSKNNEVGTLNYELNNGLINAYFTNFNETLEPKMNNFSNETKASLNNSSSNVIRYFFVSFIYVPIIICTLVGNMLVVLAVVIVRKLHTQDNANNFLIVSLAISDFLVGILAMPFAVYVELTDDNKWYLGAIVCDLWTMSDVLLCTASILNLCAISVDRYFIILHAMVYTQRRNFKLMLLMILTVWLLAGLISIPPLFGWGKPSARLQREQVCAVSDDLKYQIYATLLAFYLPLVVMIVIYFNIFRAAKKIKKREMQTAGRLQFNRPSLTSSPDYQLKSLIKTDKNAKLPNGKTKPSINSSSKKNCFRKSKEKKNSKILEEENSIKSKLFHSQSFQHINPSIDNPSSIQSSNIKRLGNCLTSAFSGMKRHSNTSASGKNQKATQTLGVIMGCFTLCWLPFFILAVFKPIPLGNGYYVADYIPKWLDSLLLWLGYFNSALNPMIYARFNREFRRPFIEILCFRCKGINNKLRDEERKKMYADETFNGSPHFIQKQNSTNNLKISSEANIEFTQIKMNSSTNSVEQQNNSSIQQELIVNDTNENKEIKSFQTIRQSNSFLFEIENNDSTISGIPSFDVDSLKKKVNEQKNNFFFGSINTSPIELKKVSNITDNEDEECILVKSCNIYNALYNDNNNSNQNEKIRNHHQIIIAENCENFEENLNSSSNISKINQNCVLESKADEKISYNQETLNEEKQLHLFSKNNIYLNQHENYNGVQKLIEISSNFSSTLNIETQLINDQKGDLSVNQVTSIPFSNSPNFNNILEKSNNIVSNSPTNKPNVEYSSTNKNSSKIICSKSPKSERSRQRKLTHANSEKCKSNSNSISKTSIPLAYCTRNKMSNGSCSNTRIISSTESLDSASNNNHLVKININVSNSKTNNIDVNNNLNASFYRIASLSTIISETEQKFYQNIESTTSNTQSKYNNNNKPNLFINNSSRHLKNNNSSIYPSSISSETSV